VAHCEQQRDRAAVAQYGSPCANALAPVDGSGRVGLEVPDQPANPAPRIVHQPAGLTEAHVAAYGVRSLRVVCMACALACLLALSGCSNGASHVATQVASPTALSRAPGSRAVSDAGPVPVATPQTSQSAQADGAAAIPEGRVLVQAQCAWCHSLSDAGISGTVGPALDHIGAGHTVQWLSAALVNACAHHIPASHYSCAQKHDTVAALTSAQRGDIVSYLLTLK